MTRLNYPEAGKFPQAHKDVLKELIYAAAIVLVAGLFGGVLALLVWGTK